MVNQNNEESDCRDDRKLLQDEKFLVFLQNSLSAFKVSFEAFRNVYFCVTDRHDPFQLFPIFLIQKFELF